MVGNVMVDTLVRILPRARQSKISSQIGVDDQPFVLVTLHRPSNVDEINSLYPILSALDEITHQLSVVFPVHPCTRQAIMDYFSERTTSNLYLIDPLGYVEFLSLQERAVCVITDSGGVQEETTYLGVPCLTVREWTEGASHHRGAWYQYCRWK